MRALRRTGVALAALVLFLVVGDSPVMEALLITRVSETEWSTQSLFETDLPRLGG